MIKFFRQIRHQLINENKMGKYFKYAIGEILLVVIGILIALQINNWNENRKIHLNENKLARQLLEDARADSIFFESRINHQKTRDNLFNNLINLSKQVNVDSISKLEVTEDPFFFRLAYQSNLINNNPDSYNQFNDDMIKSKLRDYSAKYDFVVHAIELNNRISEENGIPLQLKYYEQLQRLPERLNYADLYFVTQDIETVAIFDLFRSYGINYLIQCQQFLIVNQELIQLLETYLEENK